MNLPNFWLLIFESSWLCGLARWRRFKLQSYRIHFISFVCSISPTSSVQPVLVLCLGRWAMDADTVRRTVLTTASYVLTVTQQCISQNLHILPENPPAQAWWLLQTFLPVRGLHPVFALFYDDVSVVRSVVVDLQYRREAVRVCQVHGHDAQSHQQTQCSCEQNGFTVESSLPLHFKNDRASQIYPWLFTLYCMTSFSYSLHKWKIGKPRIFKINVMTCSHFN